MLYILNITYNTSISNMNILNINPYELHSLQIFCHSLGFFSTVLNASYAMQKLLSLT